MKTASIVWQPVPALPIYYAIESDAPDVLANARQLFAPWLIAPVGSTSEIPIAQTWRVDGAADAWNVSGHGLIERPIGSRSDALACIEYAAISHMVTHLPPAFIGFHGALLSRQFDQKERGILVVGPKEAGKSTLACALWRAGWRLHCDDFTLLDASSHAHPTARRVSLRAGSRALLGDLWKRAQQTPNARALGAGIAFHPHELSEAPPIPSEPIELATLIILNRRGCTLAPAQTQRLSGIEAAFALLPYSTLLLDESGAKLTHERADWGVGLANLARRIEHLPLYDLARAEPQAMVDAIEKLLETAN